MLGALAEKTLRLLESTSTPNAREALDRIGKLYDVERAINGRPKGIARPRAVQSRPLAGSFKTWLENQLEQLLEKTDLNKAIRYGLSRWDAYPFGRLTRASLTVTPHSSRVLDSLASETLSPLCMGGRFLNVVLLIPSRR